MQQSGRTVVENQHSAKRLGVAVAAVAVLLMPAVALCQRGQTSAIVGIVRDATGQGLGGVAVTISSPQLIGGSRTVRSDGDGRYRLTTLPSGTYLVTARSSGFATLERQGVELVAGLALTLDFTLQLAPVDTTVEVRAAVPTIDVTSSAATSTIERPLLENLPGFLDRSVVDYINLAPGIAGRVALGGAALANPISVDGTSAASPVQGDPDAEPSVNWLETIQIVTVGASAEYGEFTAAQLNTITRSGSNRFSGLGDYWWTRRAWAKFSELLEWNDASGQVGGPMIKDRVWFFGGGERFEQIRRVSSLANRPLTPDEPLAEWRQRRVIGKLTTAPSASMRLEGYVIDSRGGALNGNASPAVSLEALGAFDDSQRLDNLRWTWPRSDKTLIEARVGAYSSQNSQGPVSPERRSGPPPRIDLPRVAFSGNYPQVIDARRRATSALATVTRYLATSAGPAHEVKAGVEFERASASRDFAWPGNARYRDLNGQPNLVDFWEGARYRPSHHRTSAFVQDNWQLGSVTIEPGLRVGFYGSTVPNPASATYSNHSVSPRLGVAWDLFPDHRTVVRAHYGQYHDAMSTRFYEFLETSSEAVTITARVLGPNLFEEVTRSGGPTVQSTIDPDVKHSYAEEWLAGIERELWPRFSVKAQYVRRNTKNTIGFIDTGTVWAPVAVVDPGLDGVTGTADDGGPLTIFLNANPGEARYVMTNPSGAWRSYDGVQVVGSRRYANGWSLQGSYAWGRTLGSYDNENGSNAAGTDVGPQANFANPNRAINTTGRTVFDRRHDLRAFGTYTLRPFGGLRVSGVYRYTSGMPWGRTVTTFDPRTQASFVVVEPIGTRERQATHEADLRIEKTFPLPARATAGIYADVFNITNHIVVSQVVESSGPTFGTVRRSTDPRRLRVGLRLMF